MKIEELSAAAVNTIKSFDYTMSLPSDFFMTAENCHQSQEELLDGFQLHRNLLRRRHVRKEQKLQELQARERKDKETTFCSEHDEKHLTTSNAASHARPITTSFEAHFTFSPRSYQDQTYHDGGIALGQYHLPVSPLPHAMTTTSANASHTVHDGCHHSHLFGKRPMEVGTSSYETRPSKVRRLDL
jgi:hypothetical protein